MHLCVNRVKERAQERSLLQVEGSARLSPHVRLRFLLTSGCRLAGQRNLSEGKLQTLMNKLHRLACYCLKAGSQHLVTRHDRIESSLQRHFLQWSVNTESQGDDIRRFVGQELIKEPEALLGKRKRQMLRSRHELNEARSSVCCLPSGIDISSQFCQSLDLEDAP